MILCGIKKNKTRDMNMNAHNLNSFINMELTPKYIVHLVKISAQISAHLWIISRRAMAKLKIIKS
jgi:uncharacterized protein YueI